jgi:hypothetical protein
MKVNFTIYFLHDVLFRFHLYMQQETKLISFQNFQTGFIQQVGNWDKYWH